MTPLSNQTVFVTGASRGAGKGIAQTLIDQGAKVIVGYGQKRGAAEAFAAQHPDKIAGLVGATSPSRARRKPPGRRRLTVRAGGLTDWCLITGFSKPPACMTTPSLGGKLGAHLQVNLQSAADLARLAVRDWVGEDKPGGSLIAIASRAAHRGDDQDHPSYAASKAGMIAMIKTLARAYSGQGLLAYAIAPGWIDTEMAPQDPADRAKALAEVPYGEMASPEELGRLCAFLLGGGCPSATGATFDVNGASYVR
jgi:3-oxoacyl-[acyl-carrier protein] reductase